VKGPEGRCSSGGVAQRRASAILLQATGDGMSAAVGVRKEPYSELSPTRSCSAAGPYHVDWLAVGAYNAFLDGVSYCSFGMLLCTPARHQLVYNTMLEGWSSKIGV